MKPLGKPEKTEAVATEAASGAGALGESSPTRGTPSISVIVPAHNEEGYLGATLQALQGQGYADYEIIVVANACADKTALLARDRCDRLLILARRGISRARNLGVRLARGDILVFLDADTVLQPDALEIIAARFTREYASGTLKGKPDSPRLVFRLLYAWKNLLHRSELHKGSIGVIICWKDFFQAAGGFDERLHVMENSALIRKLDRFGKYLCIDSTAATTSMRRFQKRGFWPTTWDWLKFWLQSHWGDLQNKQYVPVR